MKKEDNEFELIYTDIRRKYQDKFDKWSKDIKLSKILYAALVVFLLVVVLILFVTPFKTLLATNKGTFYATIIAIVVVAVVIVAYASSLRSRYKKEYKATVVTDLVNRTNSNFAFSEKCADNGAGLKNAYEDAGLDRLSLMGLGQILSGVRRSMEVQTCNYIEGTTQTNIMTRMSEVAVYDVKKITRVENGSVSQSTERKNIFDGFFAHVSIPTAVPVDFSVFTNDPTPRDYYNDDVRTNKGGQRVSMGNLESWRGLCVYSEQPEKLETYATEEMGRIIRDMDKKSLIKTDIALKGNNIYIRLHQHSFINPDLKDENKNKAKLKACYDMLNFIEEFAIEVNETNKAKK